MRLKLKSTYPMISDPKSLLDNCLEIEGLIALIIQRDNNVPPHLYNLIERKISDLQVAARSLQSCSTAVDPAENVADCICAPADGFASAAEADNENDNIPAVPFSAIMAENDSSYVVESVEDNITEPAESPIPTEYSDGSVETCETVAAVSDDSEQTLYAGEESQITPVAVTEPVWQTSAVRNDLLQPTVFSLNDRFRFRRELFDYSDSDMDDAINVASSMSSAEEIEDYFYNDLCWDENNPDVVDFMRIITSRFQK